MRLWCLYTSSNLVMRDILVFFLIFDVSVYLIITFFKFYFLYSFRPFYWYFWCLLFINFSDNFVFFSVVVCSFWNSYLEQCLPNFCTFLNKIGVVSLWLKFLFWWLINVNALCCLWRFLPCSSIFNWVYAWWSSPYQIYVISFIVYWFYASFSNSW